MTTIHDFLEALAEGDTPQAAVRAGRCLLPPIGCGRSLTDDDLTDQTAAREWHISGLCPGCFNKAAGEDNAQLPGETHQGWDIAGDPVQHTGSLDSCWDPACSDPVNDHRRYAAERGEA
ncbi:hypothetical protein [Streptomyces smyrnaeus]|uniref:hypothetical protein n=1 Tax=Streptomyces smyrnaeus TaxID=1387713 RepID=UPI0033C98CBF